MRRPQRCAYNASQMAEATQQLQSIFDRIWSGEPGLEAYTLLAGHLVIPVYRVRRFGEHQIVIHEVHAMGGQGSGIYLHRGEAIPDYVAKIHLRHAWDGNQMLDLEYRTIEAVTPAFGRFSVEAAPESCSDPEMDARALARWTSVDQDSYDSQNIPEMK